MYPSYMELLIVTHVPDPNQQAPVLEKEVSVVGLKAGESLSPFLSTNDTRMGAIISP